MKSLIIILSVLSVNLYSYEYPGLQSILGVTNSVENCEENCLSLEEVVELVKKNNFETRVDALRVYQARQEIQVHVGQLLPSFNLRIMNPLEWFEYIPNLVGFLFPSNWFKLKESKLHALAQEQSFLSLMANQIQTIEGLYYSIHKESINYQIYKKHYVFSKKLYQILEARELAGEITRDEVEKMNLVLTDISLNLIDLENTLYEMYASLGRAIDLPLDWNKISLKSIKLPDLDSIDPINAKDYFENVFNVSYELKSLDYLQLAAKYSKKARAFDFLTPDSDTDSAFGFGYLSNIRIGKANVEIVKVQKEQMKAQLKEAIYSSVSNYNVSLEIHEEVKNALSSVHYLLEIYMEDLMISSEIDVDELRELLNENIFYQWMYSYSKHGLLLAQSNLDRLTLNSDHYDGIQGLLPAKKNKLKCFQRKENRKIKKEVEKGNIDLDLKFNKEEIKFCLK